jgi:hypothetical protein
VYLDRHCGRNEMGSVDASWMVEARGWEARRLKNGDEIVRLFRILMRAFHPEQWESDRRSAEGGQPQPADGWIGLDRRSRSGGSIRRVGIEVDRGSCSEVTGAVGMMIAPSQRGAHCGPLSGRHWPTRKGQRLPQAFGVPSPTAGRRALIRRCQHKRAAEASGQNETKGPLVGTRLVSGVFTLPWSELTATPESRSPVSLEAPELMPMGPARH